jgi:hypothetical protein
MKKFLFKNFMWLYMLFFHKKRNKYKVLFSTSRTEKRANKRTIEKTVTNSFARKYATMYR